jgi:xylulokinase
MNYYIGIDFGTSAIKTGLFDPCGQLIEFNRQNFNLDKTQNNFVQFDINQYIELAFKGIKSVSSKLNKSDCLSIASASQAQTFALFDENLNPLYPAISWIDSRALSQVKELKNTFPKYSYFMTDISSAPKILWLKKYRSDIFKRIYYIFFIPDYFNFLLTGKRMIDPRTAESSGFYSSEKEQWFEDIIVYCGLRKYMFSQVKSSGEKVGFIKKDIARNLNISSDTIIGIGANDNLAGAIGVANNECGKVSLSMGTALSLTASITNPDVINKTSLRPHPVKGLYAALFFTKTSGIIIDWFKNNFLSDISFDEMYNEIIKIPVGAEGICFVPDFQQQKTVKGNSISCGEILGLNLKHNKFHIARSIIEALIYLIMDNIRLIEKINKIKIIRVIGGGTKSNAWLQMISDATGISIEIPRIKEAACFGAAQLAMCLNKKGTNNIYEISNRLYNADKIIYPDKCKFIQYQKSFTRYKSIVK